MTDNRLQNCAIKIKTDFGVIHLHLDFDDSNRPQKVTFHANDDLVTPETQIGAFLVLILDGINKTIEDMNRGWEGRE